MNRKIGQGLMNQINSDSIARSSLGLGSVSGQELARFTEACREITYIQSGMGGVYAANRTDSEIAEIVKEINTKKAIRQDAGTGSFLERDLIFADPVTSDVQYQKMNWKEIIPVINQNTPGADSYQYQMNDLIGKVEFAADAASDAPTSTNNYDWFFKKIHKIHGKYDVTLDEMRAHIFGNRPLETERLKALFRGYDEKMFDVTFNGDADRDIEGLNAMSGVSTAAVSTVPTTAFVTWADKIANGHEIFLFKDIAELVGTANADSKYVYWGRDQPGVIGLPPAQYRLANETVVSVTNASNITIRQLALQNIEGLKDIIQVPEFTKMIGFIPQPEILHNRVAMDVTFQPMERRGQVFSWYSDMKIVGPILKYIPSMIYRTGL